VVAVVSILFRAEFRHRWRSWLLLALLIALVSGLVLAAAATGRRTASAFPRYVAVHGFDAQVFSAGPLPAVASLPDVELASPALIPANGPPMCPGCRTLANQDFGVTELSPRALSREVKLLSGRTPNQSNPYEVLASFTMQRDFGIHLGSIIHVGFASLAQRTEVLNGEEITTDGPRYGFTVVGIGASENEFPAANSTDYGLYTTRAFARATTGRTFAFHLDFVRLRHGAADLPRFQSEVHGADVGVIDLDATAAAVNSSIRPQAVGWWFLAGLTALVGLIVVAQALRRQAALEEDGYGTLVALGVSGRQLALLGMARTAVIGITGVVGGVLLAFGLSPLTPVGEARLADPVDGFSFDPWTFLLGGLVLTVILLALGLHPAVRAARAHQFARRSRTPRSSRIVALLGRSGAPPSALIGVRHALERGYGRSAVPVGSALAGSILAVTALCATAVFGSSLTHLTTTPALYGQPFDLSISMNSTGTPAQADQLVADVEHEHAVTAITAGLSADVSINGHTVAALGGQPIRGSLLLTTITGRLPHASDEVTLGRTTLREVGAHVGSIVRVSVPGFQGGTSTSAYRVVGVTSFPPDFGTGGLGTGAIFDFAGFGARCAQRAEPRQCAIGETYSGGGVILLHATPDSAGRSALSRLVATYHSDVSFPIAPTNLVNFGQAVNFPLILGSVLIVFGVATLLHVLVVSVTRRRTELGLLKSLGFLRRQVAFTLSWQTSTIASIGVVIGGPAGVAIGRLVWRAFADNLGVVAVPEVTLWLIIAIALGTLMVANVLAAVPAFVAARTQPANLLRAE
jgi:ABC-type antimicrobial peptide transport system permease subunit